MLTLHCWHFSRFVLGLCFLTSEKEDNAVKLRQYFEIFYNRFVQEGAFRLYCDWNKLIIPVTRGNLRS